MDDDVILLESDLEAMVTLSADRLTVRLHIPPISLEGQAEPLRLRLDLDTALVDAFLDRLASLRARMLPPPQI